MPPRDGWQRSMHPARWRRRLWSTVGEGEVRRGERYDANDNRVVLFSSPCSPAYFEWNDLVINRQNPAGPPAKLFS